MNRTIMLAMLCSACATAAPPPVAPPPQLAELASHRAQAISWLRHYREVGAFPTDDAGMPLSVRICPGHVASASALAWASPTPWNMDSHARAPCQLIGHK